MFFTSKKDLVLNCLFKGKSGLPTAFTAGLSTAAPTASGGNIQEPAASTGYQRMPVTFSDAVNGAICSGAPVDFPVFTSDAGVATHYVLFDQDGEPFWSDALTQPRTLEANSTVGFPAGESGICISLVDELPQASQTDA